MLGIMMGMMEILGRASMFWRNSLPDLNLNSEIVVAFCTSHRLSITNTKFEDKFIRGPWYQSNLGQRPMIDYMIVSPHEAICFEHLGSEWGKHWPIFPGKPWRTSQIIP